MCFKVLYKCHRKNLKTKIKKNKNTLPSVRIGTRQRNLFAERQACSTRQRQHVCRVLTASTRQRMTEGPPASAQVFCRGFFFAECLTLGKEDVCRVSLFAECLTLGKDVLCRVPALPSAALGKLPFCQVPVFRHSAKLRALSKEHVSHSVFQANDTNWCKIKLFIKFFFLFARESNAVAGLNPLTFNCYRICTDQSCYCLPLIDKC